MFDFWKTSRWNVYARRDRHGATYTVTSIDQPKQTAFVTKSLR
jgi:hypothetical protein